MAILLAALSAACSGDNGTGLGPSGTNSTPRTSACRNYGTSYTKTYTFRPAESGTCSFNSMSNVFSCTSSCWPSVARYASLADFVDESQTMGRILRQGFESTDNCGGNGHTSLTYSYDSQKRVITYGSPGIQFTVTTWDGRGRPVRAVSTLLGLTETTVYDDAARTVTTSDTSSSLGPLSVETLTYDSDGNLVRDEGSGGGTATVESTTVLSTATVCH
jgi:YD repeat-containing protein